MTGKNKNRDTQKFLQNIQYIPVAKEIEQKIIALSEKMVVIDSLITVVEEKLSVD